MTFPLYCVNKVSYVEYFSNEQTLHSPGQIKFGKMCCYLCTHGYIQFTNILFVSIFMYKNGLYFPIMPLSDIVIKIILAI